VLVGATALGLAVGSGGVSAASTGPTPAGPGPTVVVAGGAPGVVVAGGAPGVVVAGGAPGGAVAGGAPAIAVGGAAEVGVAVGPGVASGREVSLTLDLAGRDEAGAEAYALAVSTPGSPGYGHYLYSNRFQDRFGPRPAAVRAVRAWVAAHGLVVDEAVGRQALVVHGSAAAVSAAFGGVRLQTATAGGATGVRADGELRVPATIGPALDSVGGLSGPPARVVTYSTVTNAHPRVVPGTAGTTAPTGPAAAAASTSAAAGTSAGASPTPRPGSTAPCATWFGRVPARLPAPPPVRARATSAVECSWLPGPGGGYVHGASNAKIRRLDGSDARNRGAGRTVGIVLWGNDPGAERAADAQARANGDPVLRRGQYTTNLSTAARTGCQPAGTDAGLEQDLDLQAVRVSAPLAAVRYFANTRCVVPELTLATAVDQDRVQVLSNSWGYANYEYDPRNPHGANYATGHIAHRALVEAAALGITVLFATGDSGDGRLAGNARQGSPGYPATDPFAVAVGGIGFGTSRSGGVAFRSGWSNGFFVRAGSRWARVDPVAVGGANAVGSSGGVSAYWSAPAWQRRAGVAKLGRRVVPDVANLADGYFDPFLVYQQPEGLEAVGGTSVAAPLTAGLVTASLGALHRARLGLVTPALYANRRRGAVDDVFFRQDAVSGAVPGQPGVLVGSEIPQEGLRSRPGWDDVTGLGSPGPRFAALLH